MDVVFIPAQKWLVSRPPGAHDGRGTSSQPESWRRCLRTPHCTAPRREALGSGADSCEAWDGGELTGSSIEYVYAVHL